MKLNDYKRWFSLSLNDFIAEYKIDSAQVHENVRYEKITDVTRVDGPNEEFLFFSSGSLKMIYISNEAQAESLWREFNEAFDSNTSEKMVRSRAGKTSNQLIFAGQGFTASIKNEEVDFIEIYPPCSLQDYLDNIYKEPGLFIR